jgi:hypothetical protein
MTRVIVPAQATSDQSWFVLECCEHLRKDPAVRWMDASGTTAVDPMGAVLLAVAVGARGTAGLPPLELVPPPPGAARSFLEQVGFLAFMAGEDPVRRPADSLGLRRMDLLAPLYT